MATENSAYLFPGIQEHDIISGQVRLCEVSGDFFDLTHRAGVNSDFFILVLNEKNSVCVRVF